MWRMRLPSWREDWREVSRRVSGHWLAAGGMPCRLGPGGRAGRVVAPVGRVADKFIFHLPREFQLISAGRNATRALEKWKKDVDRCNISVAQLLRRSNWMRLD